MSIILSNSKHSFISPVQVPVPVPVPGPVPALHPVFLVFHTLFLKDYYNMQHSQMLHEEFDHFQDTKMYKLTEILAD